MFKKGESGNPNGRKPGTINKVNQEIREKINAFLESGFDDIQTDIKQLEPKDRVKFYIDLLSFGLPKLKNVEIEADVNDNRPIQPIITTLTREELLKRLEK